MLSSDAQFQKVILSPHTVEIRDLIREFSGINHADNRLRYLENRCFSRMRSLHISSLAEYRNVLTASKSIEISLLLNEVTIGETSFFRNRPQMETFRNAILPAIIRNKERLPMKRIRLWSAGCSTGEEPYSLAIACMEEAEFGSLKGVLFEVAATDINEKSLARAKEGIYSEYSTRNMRCELRQKYFSEANGTWRVNDVVRQYVTFSRVNLLDDSRMVFLKGMDVIFCCNVLIYFDMESKKRVIQHFYNNLMPKSYLFLGHSESLFGVTDDFENVHFPGAIAYLKAANPARKG